MSNNNMFEIVVSDFWVQQLSDIKELHKIKDDNVKESAR